MSVHLSPNFIDGLEVCPSQLLGENPIPYPSQISYDTRESKNISIISESKGYKGDGIFLFGKKLTISEGGIAGESNMVENNVIIEGDDNVSRLQIWAGDKSQLILNLDGERKVNEYEEVADVSSFRLDSDMDCEETSEININHEGKDWTLINPNNIPLGLLENNLLESIKIARELIGLVMFDDSQISADLQTSIAEFKVAALSAYKSYKS